MLAARRKETTMKQTLTSIACLLILVTASAQEQKKSAPAKPASENNASVATVLEAKIRKAWEDYKNRKKEAFAAILADGFAEVTNDADGVIGKDIELAEMDSFSLSHYQLRDFKLKPVGNAGAVMIYTAEYSGTYGNVPVQMKAIYGDWRLNLRCWNYSCSYSRCFSPRCFRLVEGCAGSLLGMGSVNTNPRLNLLAKTRQYRY